MILDYLAAWQRLHGQQVHPLYPLSAIRFSAVTHLLNAPIPMTGGSRRTTRLGTPSERFRRPHIWDLPCQDSCSACLTALIPAPLRVSCLKRWGIPRCTNIIYGEIRHLSVSVC